MISLSFFLSVCLLGNQGPLDAQLSFAFGRSIPSKKNFEMPVQHHHPGAHRNP